MIGGLDRGQWFENLAMCFLDSKLSSLGRASRRRRARRDTHHARTPKRTNAMSFAAPKLRAERRRYVMELTNPSVVPETPAHLLDDADDDAAWDDDASPFDAVAAAGKATRRMEMKTPPVVTEDLATAVMPPG